ncbi:MAG: methyl-accepting chemotaxis protein [Treponema sp.]|nr:methyl-accepting chemotaxis protein [Treponema sp.]
MAKNLFKSAGGNKSILARRIVILCLSLVISVSIILSWIFLSNLTNVNNRSLHSTAAINMRYLNLDILHALEPSLNLASSVAAIIPDIATPAQMEQILSSMLSTVSAAGELFYGTTVSRFDGGYFVTATDWDPYGDNLAWDQILRPWFSFGLGNPGRTMITEPYVDSNTGLLCVSVVRTVDVERRIVGVVGVDVFLDVLTEIVISRTITEDGNTFIISSDGTYLVHNNGAYIMERNFFETEGRDIQISASDVDIQIIGNTYWASMPISGMDWIMITTGSTDEFTRDFRQILTTTIIISLVIILAVIIISLRFSMILTKAIVGLFGTLKKIAAGDFTQTIAVKGNDEISQMAKLLGETQESIKNLISNIKNEATALSEIGNDLASDMQGTASSMKEITDAVQNIKGRIINQSASVSETHATMEQLVSNINKLNSHVGRQSSNVSQASSAIEEMVANTRSVTDTLIRNEENVRTLTEASEVGKTGLSEVAHDIREIARESEGLLEINAVMKNISSQTNLLSMNAAIEAAHAGDSGKGFAVVADEIRKLAINSSEQSKTIGTVLKRIKESIDKITRSTENVLNKFEAINNNIKTVADQEEIIRNAMEEQGVGSKQILEGVSNVNEITRQVETGSHEMLEGAKEVISESDNLEKATQEITTGINEIATGADHMNNAINHVNTISDKNRMAIDTLIKEVSRFKVE